LVFYRLLQTSVGAFFLFGVVGSCYPILRIVFCATGALMQKGYRPNVCTPYFISYAKVYLLQAQC
jgi:hypothetical protein